MRSRKGARAARSSIENSQHGRVADIHFLLPESGLSIIGEHFLDIHACLMGLGHGPFRAAYSHPQALGQSRHYLRDKGIVPMSYADTAGAPPMSRNWATPPLPRWRPGSRRNSMASISSRKMSDAHDNTTRFVLLAQKPLDPATIAGEAITTFVFEVRNIPAALYKALGGFATNGVNMTKLESYQKGELCRDDVLCRRRGQTRSARFRPCDGGTRVLCQQLAHSGHVPPRTRARVRPRHLRPGA
jgi:prephenate dehydratase